MTAYKHWIALCVLLMMLLCGASAYAEGEQAITVGEWTVEPIFRAQISPENVSNQPNALRLIGYNGQDSEITIPDALEFPLGTDGRTTLLPVVELGENLFSGNAYITQVSMGDGIRTIGAGAFYRCVQLERVRLSASVSELAQDLFTECRALREIVLPNVLRKIGSGCFEGCAALEEVKIPETVTYIGAYAFKHCESLKSISLPRRVEYIGGQAFSGTAWLENQASEWVMAGDGVLLLCRSREERLVLPNNIKMISSAFEGNDTLKEIVLPESLEIIGEYAFADCTALLRVECTSGVRQIGAYAFENCTALVRVPLTDGLKQLGRGAFRGCTSLTQVSLPDSVTRLEAEVFADCTALREVTIPLSVQSVDETAFGRGQGICICAVYGSAGERFAREKGLSCLFLRQRNEEYVYLRTEQGIEILEYIGQASVLEMPDELDGVPITSVGAGAFQQAYSLRAVTLSANISTLEDWAFADLYRLEQVMLGEKLTDIGENTFSGCVALREIYLPQGIEQLPQSTFEGCVNLRVLADPDSEIFRLAQEAGLKTVNVLTEYDAFLYEKHGDALALCGYVMDEHTLSLPARYAGRDVTAVGTGAFGAGRWIIDVPEGYTSLESGAFSGCTELDITLPRSVTFIAEDALTGCAQVTIRGYVGTEAEAYARRIGCRFIVRHDW